MGLSMPPHPTAQVDVVDVDGIAAELITHPNSRSDRIVLYLHGGVFCTSPRKGTFQAFEV